MELLKKISDREIKLIMLFVTVILCIFSYQFGYLKYQQKAVRLRTENTNMRIQVEELNRKQANKAEILRKTEENKERAELLIGEFPVRLEQEGTTLLLRTLREYSGWKISQISYDDISVFYSDTAPVDAAAVSGTVPEPSTQVQEDGRGITGYKTSVTISYQTTYVGLKNGIDYINRHENRMNISDLTAAFDHTTGNLTGSITLVLYAVDGLGRDRQETIYPNVSYGIDNIFGSFEITNQVAAIEAAGIPEEAENNGTE